MPKPKLPRDCVITLSGDFGENRRPAQYADWVQKAGARLQTSLTDDTTHFIVSDEHWSAQKPMVRQALKKKGLHILKQDWLDGVLQGRNLNAKSYDLRQQRIPALLAVSKGEAVAVKGSAPRSRKRKLVDEAPAIKRPRKNTAAAALFDETQRYLPKNAKAKKASEKPKTGLLAKSVINKSVQAAVEHYDRGSKMAKADHVSENNHIYVDQEGFVYEIILSKVQMEFNINQSVVLKIFESDYDPHVYTMVEHDRGGALMEAKAPHHYATGTNFATAYRALKTRFNHHTGRSWDERDQFPHKRQRPPAMHTAAGAPSTKAARRPLLAAPSKTISEAQIEVFQAQPYEYRNPPIDQPQGVTGPTPSPNALQGQLSFGQPEEAQSTFGGADDADIMDGGDTGMQQE